MFYFGNNILRIILGEECNMNCLYCGQHANKNKIKPTEISEKFLDYMHYLNDILHYSGKIMQLQFFGGEPLLYFDKIKTIINYINTLQYDTFVYNITTNGKLLDEEKIKWFNENKFNVCLSWDGDNTDKTRFFDVIKDANFDIFNIECLSISSVVTKYNYKYDIINAQQKIADKYFDKTGRYIHGTNVIYMCDLNNDAHDLSKFDYNKLTDQYHKLFNKYREYLLINNMEEKQKFFDKNYLFINYAKNYIELINKEISNTNEIKSSFCDLIVDALPIDLEGNIYSCSQVMNKPIGNVITDDSKTLLNSYAQSEYYIMNRRANICKGCNAQLICRGGCKLVDNNKLDSTCELEKMKFDIIYNEIIETQKLLEEQN